MSNTCDIEFLNSPRKIVYAGQLLRGTVRLQLMETTSVRSVYIRINGKAFAKWLHGEQLVRAKENFLDENVILLGETTLEPGTYSYEFEFLLPSDVPSTIVGKYGKIKYNVRVVLDKSLQRNKEFKEQFTLFKALNLNDFPTLRQPLIVEKMNKVFPMVFCCFTSNKLKISAKAPAGGFIPGQTIDLEINVNNRNNVSISGFTVELIRLIKYTKVYKLCFKDKYEKYEERPLLQKSSDGCGENEDKVINISVDVPATPPTEILMSKIIKVTYLIRIRALLPSYYINKSLDVPITIGSYPFQDEALPQLNTDSNISSD